MELARRGVEPRPSHLFRSHLPVARCKAQQTALHDEALWPVLLLVCLLVAGRCCLLLADGEALLRILLRCYRAACCLHAGCCRAGCARCASREGPPNCLCYVLKAEVENSQSGQSERLETNLKPENAGGSPRGEDLYRVEKICTRKRRRARVQGPDVRGTDYGNEVRGSVF